MLLKRSPEAQESFKYSIGRHRKGFSVASRSISQLRQCLNVISSTSCKWQIEQHNVKATKCLQIIRGLGTKLLKLPFFQKSTFQHIFNLSDICHQMKKYHVSIPFKNKKITRCFLEKRMFPPPPPRVSPCALLKEGKERDMTVLKRKRLLE